MFLLLLLIGCSNKQKIANETVLSEQNRVNSDNYANDGSRQDRKNNYQQKKQMYKDLKEMLDSK